MTSTSRGRVAGKVALVTGAGSGIGRASATLLGREGARVFAADIDVHAAGRVATEITEAGGIADAIELDVSSEAAWQSAIKKVLSDCTRLDILVNSAGISGSRPVAESSLEGWHKVLAVNLDGVFLGTKYAIEAMTRCGGGSIVNLASVSGIRPSAGASAYCASKAAVRIFSRAVAIECADARTGVRVNLVTPGGVKTPMWEKEAFFQAMITEHGGTEEAFAAMTGGRPSQEFFTPGEIAETILYLASDESAHVSGTEIVLDRGHTG